MPRVTVACSPAARQVFEQVLDVAPGATVRDAVIASGLSQALPGLDWAALAPGIWGRAAAWDQAVRDQDRVELCRPLTVDPKVARRIGSASSRIGSPLGAVRGRAVAAGTDSASTR